MIVAQQDELCLRENAEHIFAKIGPTKKTIRFVIENDGLMPDHSYFARVAGKRFVDAIIDSIENDAQNDIPAMRILELTY